MKVRKKGQMYDRYMTSYFGILHKNKDFKKELSAYHRYFKKNYLEHMPKDRNSKILDIGSGMGHFLYFLKREGYRDYLGIDISEENIKFCEEKGFNVKLCDVFDFLKKDTEFFDLIVMNDIIEHLNKQEVIQILELANKNLAGNGKIIVKTPNASNPILGSATRYTDFTHEMSFTEESLSQVLRLSGFENIKVYPQDIYIFYENPLNYIAKFISKLLNFIFRLFFLLYGRKTTKIFTKSIIAVAVKK